MAEHKGKLVAGGVIAVVGAIGIALVVMAVFSGPLPSGEANQTTTPIQQRTSVTSTFTTLLPSATFLQGNFSATGETPLVVIGPDNYTFTMTYNFTAFNFPLILSYDPTDSYAVQYSNSTQWLNTSRPCESSTLTNTDTITTNATTQSAVVTTYQVPCGAANGEWYPIDGVVVSPHLQIQPNEVQMSITPTNIPMNTTKVVQITVSIEIHSGVYAIDLAVNVQTPGTSASYLLGYTPLIVQA